MTTTSLSHQPGAGDTRSIDVTSAVRTSDILDDPAGSDIPGSPDVTHEPLTPDRHAELVVELLHHAPRAHRVLFRPSIYLYDDRDHIRASWIEARCAELRVRFNSETDWDGANEIIRSLLRFDENLYHMSIGVCIDGRNYYGEAL